MSIEDTLRKLKLHAEEVKSQTRIDIGFSKEGECNKYAEVFLTKRGNHLSIKFSCTTGTMVNWIHLEGAEEIRIVREFLNKVLGEEIETRRIA
ncbi:hypothetical protein LCGC14_1696680 [marine sediment metagenome]|uniref:Uncharacterized protein n=1 Tax=marine sediment metagenome TaxID=412755 RepID=A0A0F9HJP0_9ZZZZ